MKRFFMLVALAAITLSGSISLNSPSLAADAKSVVKVKQDMRMLWEDHIVYTRNYIISALANLPDKDAVAARLLKNQDDIGNAIKPYYGDKAGNKLSALLREHISIATEVVNDAKIGDKAKLGDAQKKWQKNADDIAEFLGSANPNWDKGKLRDMLHKHLAFTTDETVARLKKDWAADIKAYDDNHLHMLMFSDMLTTGIAKQFPKKFTMAAS